MSSPTRQITGGNVLSIVIPKKRFSRREESGRAARRVARRVALFATQQSRVWLASLLDCTIGSQEVMCFL
jgi:hypothetical protein